MYLRMILCTEYTVIVYIYISILCLENSYTKVRCIDVTHFYYYCHFLNTDGPV